MFKIGFQAERAMTIEKPVDEVYSMVADFNTWRKWSPWICQEPNCPVVVEGPPGGVGHYQAWNGKRIGVGSMKITQAKENVQLDYALTFQKPWESSAKVVFKFQDHGSGTGVLWHMEGNLPFFLFFMKKKMSAWVRSDYERGLSMLKDQLETGEVKSASDFQNVVERGAFHYVGIRAQCKIDEIGQKMQADFQLLGNDVANGKLPRPDSVIALYNKFDFISRDVDYVSGFTYKEKTNLGSISGYEIGSARGHKALKVVHTGSYRHLGNAWSTAMGAQFAHKKRVNKSVPMYEIYENSPHEVEEKDLVTSVYVPVR